jgi:hypothetical protein
MFAVGVSVPIGTFDDGCSAPETSGLIDVFRLAIRRPLVESKSAHDLGIPGAKSGIIFSGPRGRAPRID